MTQRLLVLGLDSAPLSLLEPWIQAGKLPNLSRLIAGGATGILNSTFPPLSPAAWSSFATGMNPGKHGVFDHGYRQPGTYKIVPTNARLRGGKALWEIIGEQGGKVGVINVPETYPPQPVNGFLITGMSTPSDEADWCYPPSLKTELQKAIGGYKVYGQRSKENLDLSLAGMHQTIPMRIRAAAHLWKAYAPHLLILVLMETDVVQHKTWKYMDPAHPHYDRVGAQKYGRAILEVYQRVDENLPLLLDGLDEESAVIVMSDHGAGPIEKWLSLNNWLMGENFLHLKPNPAARLRHLLFRLGWTPNNAYKIAAALQLGMVDRAANQLMVQTMTATSQNGDATVERDKPQNTTVQPSHLLSRLFLSFADVDWSRTRAYTLGGNLTGIWVNLKGREPQGCVSPGAEYEQIRDQLIARLRAMRDPSDGLPIATKIYRREEVYQGPYLDRAPDVLFETRDEQYIGFGMQEFVTNRLAEPSPLFSGTHRRAGMVSLSGAPFRKGARLNAHQIVDLAPTILHLLGYTIPSDMDGQVMSEALTAQFHASHPIQISGESWLPSPDDHSGYSVEDEAAISERLKGLGYL